MHLCYHIVNNKYQNLKHVIKEEFCISDRLLLKLKNNNKIFLNNNNTYLNHKVNLEDIIDVFIDFEEDNSNIVPTKINLNIVYEDDCMLILNKPPNLAIHPCMDNFENSLSNGVRYYFDSINLKKKIRPVNRLDKNTSGLVIFAKNEYIQECLVRQMKSNVFKKYYIAIVEGIFNEKSGIINLPIAREENSIIKRCVNNLGDIAITNYTVIKEKNNMSILNIELKTGRTHQIRVHMSYIGHPLIGDTLYGNSSIFINRQALHAYKISFIHPITKLPLNFETPLPYDLSNIIY